MRVLVTGSSRLLGSETVGHYDRLGHSVVAVDSNTTVFGYRGKQVRDQIHSADVIAMMQAFIKNPRPGEVYNMGGGRQNSVSILESITRIEAATGSKINWSYADSNRVGDHICYITNIKKFRSHYPNWNLQYSLDDIIENLIRSYSKPPSLSGHTKV